MYIRKTKDIYNIIWNNEVIDEANTITEAKYLKQEYNIAFGGGVIIKKKRVKK